MNAESMIEADANFRAQFDRNSQTYHGGPAIPVATGGSRVPQGLEGAQDWTSLPEQPPEEKKSYGPEYDEVERVRNLLGDLKKAITLVSPPVEAIMTLTAKLKATSDPEQKLKLEKSLEVEVEKRREALASLEAFKASFPSGTEFASKAEVIDEIMQASLNAEQMTKEQQTDFGLMTKKHTSTIFREQKTLLERMKKLKKEAETKK